MERPAGILLPISLPVKPQSTFRSLLVAAGSSLLALSSSHAATLYWDGTSTTANADGGTGNWDNNNLTNWDTLALVGANSVWLNSTPDLAVFGGTAGTVSLTSAITTGGIQFNTTGYTINTGANTLTFAAGTNNILFNAIAAATITDTVAGSGNVVLAALNPFTARTLTLNGTSTNGWTGTTTINAGMTLSLAANNQALRDTTGITLNGGGITLTNTNNTEGALNRVAAMGITSNGGTITHANSATGTAYAEVLGTVALTKGQLNIVSTNAVTSGTQTLTLGAGSLAHAAANTSTITFSGASLGLNARNSVIVTSEADSAVGEIIGAWATWGPAAGSQSDYATYNRTAGGVVNAFGIQKANIAATAQDSASWTAGGKNVTLGGSTTLTGTRTLNSLRWSTADAGDLVLGASTFSLETNGLLNGGGGVLTVRTTGTGALTTPTGGGNLYLTAGNSGSIIIVSTPINNHSAGGVTTLVKNGSGNLNLSSTTSNFSGGIILNAGSLNTEANTNLGSGGGITVNGTISWRMGAAITVYNRTLTLNDGAILTLTSANYNGKTVSGVLSGNGSLFANSWTDFIFSNAANTFQGAIQSAAAGSTTSGLTFASIGDLAGAGLITLVGGSGTFHWSSASGSTTTLANRQFAISGTGPGMIAARGTAAASNLVINRDLLLTGAAGDRNLRLDGTNTGNNTFAGLIANGTDGGASVVSLTKNGASLWILSGPNTYSGPTMLWNGTLVVTSSANLGDGSATNSLIFNGGTLRTDGAITWPSTRGVTMTGAGTINTNGNALTIGGSITGAGALTKTGASDLTLSNANTFTGTTTVSAGKVVMAHALALQNSSYTTTGSNGTTIGLDVTSGLSSGNLTLGGLAGAVNLVSAFTAGFTGTVTQLTLNPQAGISNIYSAAIANGSMALIKTGVGTQVFASNNSYSGTTTITAGILNANASAALGNGSATNTLVFNGGTLQAAAAITSAATRGVTMTGTGIIDTNNFEISIAGNITGPGGLTKIGIGTLTLSGANTYTGATTVNGGTLLINGSTSNTSLVTVGINGTLGGTGTVGGNTTISGIHSPGNSPGIQTFFGNLSYVNGGPPNPTVNWKLASNTTTVGANPTANFDQIIVMWGNLDFTHTTNLNLSFNGVGSTVLWSDSLWDFNQSWLLYDLIGLGSTTNIANLNLNTTNWLDSGSNLFSTAGGSFTLSQNGEDVMLNFTAVPEPSTYGIALSAMALAVAAVRRQRRKKI